jgi:hypothetical protein
VSWIPGWDTIAATGWWSGFFFWASIVSLIGLGISEIASHRYSERKDELVTQQQLTEKKQHDDQIARLHLETANADARAAEANKKANEAQERTEAERLQRIKLEQQVAPRRFGPENLKEASQKLTGLAGHLANVSSYSLDLESALFAGQIVDLLKNAGLAVTDNRSSILPMGGFSIGVHMSGSDKKAVEEVALVLWAFSNAVVKIDAAPSPLQGQDAATSPISILVGAKPIDAPAGGIVVGPDDKILVPPIGTVIQK